MAIYTLSKLCESLQSVIASQFGGVYRIVAETMDVRRNPATGHCYMELVEKAAEKDHIVAKAKAIIWDRLCAHLFARFEEVTGRVFESGLTVLVSVKVEYHPLFGLSLQIIGIEPEYTLGDIAQKRRELIEKLKAEGIFELNKQRPIPKPTKLIAIVSSPSAAGWGDFYHHVSNNPYGLPFYCQLFHATMQGEGTAQSILSALDAIRQSKIPFEAVVIIRGGGATSDLQAFDGYELAHAIACFPLPVITGIGHQKDESLLDLVAALALKTPTAVADFLLRSRLDLLEELDILSRKVKQGVRGCLRKKHHRLSEEALRLPATVTGQLLRESTIIARFQQRLVRFSMLDLQRKGLEINTFSSQLRPTLKHLMLRHNKEVETIAKMLPNTIRNNVVALRDDLENKAHLIGLLSPQKTLERGFSVVRVESKSITGTEQLSLGSELSILFARGAVDAKITSISPLNKDGSS